MTKMQAIAQTVLTVLGVYAVVTLCHSYPGRYMHATSTQSSFGILLEVVFFPAFIVFVGLVGYILILRNGPLAEAIVDDDGSGQPVDAVFLARSLRIGFVLAALMLLPGSVPFLVKTLGLPFVLRPIVNEWIVSGGFSSFLKISWAQWYMTGFELFRAILMVYLIAGAPHLLRAQVRWSLPPKLDMNKMPHPFQEA
jgi:hypothetical protein